MTQAHTITTEQAKKQLTSWIDKRMGGSEPSVVMARITPDAARSILERYNTGNRSISPSLVARYTRIFNDNRWLFTGESIIFSNERLLNGQQRLTACAQSGVAFDSVIVFGVADEAFEVMDTGKKRTSGDVLSALEVPYANSVGAILRFITKWEEGHRSGSLWQPVDNDIIVEQWYKKSDVLESVHYSQKASKAKLPQPKLIASMHYLAAQKSRRDADDFFSRIVDGLGFDGRRDPAYILRNKLVAGNVGPNKIGRDAIVNLIAQAWNHHRKGTQLSNMRVIDKTPSLR
jgi:hypothetical protein